MYLIFVLHMFLKKWKLNHVAFELNTAMDLREKIDIRNIEGKVRDKEEQLAYAWIDPISLLPEMMFHSCLH